MTQCLESAAPPVRFEPTAAPRPSAEARFSPVSNPSSFRKLAAAMWPAPHDPSIVGSMDIDATPSLALIEEIRQRAGVKITVTHLVARATALAIARHPELNVRVRFGARFEQRRTVDVFLSVATEGGRDLSGAKIERADEKDAIELARELGGRAKSIRAGADRGYQASRNAFRILPWWLLRSAARVTDVLTNELDVDLPSRGLPRDPFGSAIVTSVGMFGIDTAFAPLVPLARCAMLILVPEVRERAWVVDGRVVPRPVLRLCATFDHRVVDGFAAGSLARTLRGLLDDPRAWAVRQPRGSCSQQATVHRHCRGATALVTSGGVELARSSEIPPSADGTSR
jgi:pyruvate dehydrogenase E2 component (dihydrolipoamide acetyltransferase)